MQAENANISQLGGEAAKDSKSEKVDNSKGARPKVRNPKEAKRRRFVMKQAKTISKPQALESVSETEESQTLLPKADADPIETSPEKSKEFFGVRSYVHTFYEAMAMDNPHGYEDIESPFGYIMPKRKRREQILCWRIIFASGLFILFMGLIALSVGFLVPKRKEVVDSQEDIEIIDRSDQVFNQDLDICKIVGIILFCVGGLLVTIVLLALTIMWKSKVEDPLSLEEIEIPTNDMEQVPNTPIDAKVPATEEVSAVQPKRVDPDEVVMTNAGLCKIP